MWIDFLSAIALVFILEGIMPFAQTARWRKLLKMALEQDNRVLRTYGFFSMLAGVVLLTVVHQLIE